MAYEPNDPPWEDYPSTATLITADRLRHIEDGLAAAADTADAKLDASAASPFLVVVQHGDDAGYARPAVPNPVGWVGSVEPANMDDDLDLWFEVASAFSGPLDGFSAPHRAHSLRRLLSAYSGPAIKVRRSSDSATLDIGFDAAGDLDTAALLAFCGAGAGYIDTWYDQSGNARHVSQATSGSQPRIVNAGVLDTLGSAPALVFDGTDDYLAATSVGLYAAGAATLAVVMSGASASNATCISESNAATAGAMYRMVRSSSANWNTQATNDSNASMWASTASGSNVFEGGAHQLVFADSAGVINTWKDGSAAHVALTATRSGALTPTRFALGASVQTSVANYLTGKIQEVVAWGSDETGNRAAISLDQKTYWGTP